jgi:hypothetical protein
VALTSAVLTIGSFAVAAAEAGEPLPAQLRQSIAELQAALATAAAGGALSPEHALPASISNAAVIASLTARCTALTGHAADADAGASGRQP